ncbi:hypothetical protein HHL11_32930 [Ramlibacter sp. G-1-2-2]|uniref:Uncharacterized protein n=1 Tax=Ramlibacter agri TaxID=2728837 RepID=A0A848HDP2_9BURK|nr:hypothetical protein [Ramlibacter agri]NML48594.1 hypothetical protein [Ramlibacter agri]
MSGLGLLRIAALCAFAYAALCIAGLVTHFQHTGNFGALLHGLLRPEVGLVFAIALLVGIGVWARYAWAWWVGLAAAVFQIYRITIGYWHAGRIPHAFAVLLALALLIAFLVLVLQRKARLACNR